MMSVGRLSAGQEAYYLEEVVAGTEDYYLSAGEAPGRWTGRLAARLGLTGTVTAEPLDAVLAGLDPTGVYKLRATPASRPGYDLTLSAPKSVSLIWGLGNPAIAAQVVEAHERAVDEALTYLEGSACHLRRGHGGVDRVEGGGFVGAAFRHRTSRAGDPDLHTHVLVANMSEGDDGRWTALDGRSIFGHARTAGFVYQTRLRHELGQRLGLVFGEVTKGYADVVGVPDDLRIAMSTRRQQIVGTMADRESHTAKGAQVAALDTRKAKSGHVTEDELRARWAEQAAAFAFTVDQVPRRHEPAVDVSLDGELLARRVTDANATFERKDVIRELAAAAWQGTTLDEIEQRTDAFLAGRFAIPVREGRWTTPEILELEQDTIERAVAPGRRWCGVVDVAVVQHHLGQHPQLGTDQWMAALRLTRDGGAISVVIGPAGSGKTTMLDVARQLWEDGGYRVIGAALAAKAASELADGAHIPSTTADRLLSQIRRGQARLDERTVVVVDEAGMLGTRRLAALAEETHGAGAKLVLVGDPAQLAEIDAGGLFASLAHRVVPSVLTENRRQRDSGEQTIARQLRERATTDAVSSMQRHGRITTAPTGDALRDVIVRDWLDHRSVGADTLMIAARRVTVADLNDRARQALRDVGRLGDDIVEVRGLGFALGDEVLAHHNDYRLGILNGDRATVLGATRHTLALEMADGRHLRIPLSYVEDGHLTHGYATTVHKAQGTTCDQLLVLGDDTFTIETAYTSLTRGRDRNQLYLAQPDLDPDHHGAQVVGDLIDAFTDAISRSEAKVAAVDWGIEIDL